MMKTIKFTQVNKRTVRKPAYFTIYTLCILLIICSIVWVSLFYSYYSLLNYLGLATCITYALVVMVALPFTKHSSLYVALLVVTLCIGVIYTVLVFKKISTPDANIEGFQKMFRPSFVTPEMDHFQYENQCCGWLGPEDYSISFPLSCCGRKNEHKEGLRAKICDDPYPNGCKFDYIEIQNTLEAWRMICDFVRLILIISIFILLAKYYVVILKRKKRLKLIKTLRSKIIVEKPDQNGCAKDEQCSLAIMYQDNTLTRKTIANPIIESEYEQPGVMDFDKRNVDSITDNQILESQTEQPEMLSPKVDDNEHKAGISGGIEDAMLEKRYSNEHQIDGIPSLETTQTHVKSNIKNIAGSSELSPENQSILEIEQTDRVQLQEDAIEFGSLSTFESKIDLQHRQ